MRYGPEDNIHVVINGELGRILLVVIMEEKEGTYQEILHSLRDNEPLGNLQSTIQCNYLTLMM